MLVILSHGSFVLAADLRWKNGESLPGEVISATTDQLTWTSPTFAEPLTLDLRALQRVEFAGKDSTTEEPFSIRLSDGSRLYGKITDMDDSTLSVTSAHHGGMRLQRAAVVSVQRLQADSLVYAGPTSPADWEEQGDPRLGGNNPTVPLWRSVATGRLVHVGWNHTVSLPLDLPERVEMRFTLSSSVRPEFKLDLQAAEKQRLVIETWDDEVVLQGREFASAQKLAETERSVTLTAFWDRKAGRCALYGAQGMKLAETQLAPAVAATPDGGAPAAKPGIGGIIGGLAGLFRQAVQNGIANPMVNRPDMSQDSTVVGLNLLNKGPDLTLDSLRIREWDGRLPEKISTKRPCVEMLDGRVLDLAKGTALKWDDVLAVEFDTPPAAAPAPTGTELWFTDGTWITGRWLGIEKRTVKMQCAFASAPIALQMAGLHRIELRLSVPEKAVKESALAKLDMLTVGGRSLHGTLEAAGGPVPRWLAVGAARSVALKSAASIEITRALPGDAPRPEALFYLRTGDVVPGTLRSLDSALVDIDSQVTDLRQIPADQLHGIQFANAALAMNGFDDPGWQRTRGGESTAKRSGNAVDLQPGGSWGHPSFCQVGEMKFDVVCQGYTSLRLRLFSNGVDMASRCTNIVFYISGSQVTFGLERGDGQMDQQSRMSMNGRATNIGLKLSDEAVEVLINGALMRKFTGGELTRSGLGFVVEPCNLWGNGEQPVKISAFKASITPGSIAAPAVDAKAREHALMVPRFRKEDPPRHVLLAANGDLLRGVIEAATARHFSIRSGLETLQVPRDRVTAAVWLTKLDADPKEPVRDVTKDATHWLLLSSGARLALKVTAFEKDALLGHSALLGDCRVPLTQLASLRSTAPVPSAAMLALRSWQLRAAPEPVLPESGGQSSPLLDKEAKGFTLPLLGGGDFDLSKEKGKVIVLDFWATWCGPCIKSLPEMIATMSELDPQKVRFIGVNQAESAEQVKKFIETRGWRLTVALDAQQRVGQQFGVEGIPHTVVIGPDGKIAWVKTGYEPEGAQQLKEAVNKLIGTGNSKP